MTRLSARESSPGVSRSVRPGADGDSRALSREIVAEAPVKSFGFCRYCAGPCYGPTCASHRDLLALDPSSPTVGHLGAW